MTQGAHVFPSFTQNIGTNTQKLANPDNIQVALIASGTFNWVAATQAYTTLAQFLANTGAGGGGALTEVSTGGTGYSRQTLVNPTFTQSGLVNVLGCSTNIVWTATAAWSAVYAVFYDITVSNDLICYWDFGGTSAVTSGGAMSIALPGGQLVTWTSS
jgi:hypothetical protein